MIRVSGVVHRDAATIEGVLPSQAIDPATPAGVQPDSPITGRTLTFSDEFTGTSLDRVKWDPWYPDTSFWNATQPGGHLTNTDNPQAYDPSAITFDGVSTMTFTMTNESIVAGLPLKSGMVSSYPSFAQSYGYYEARMRLPARHGSWPAFWLDPLDQTWPPEIDIMESWGGTVVGQNYIPPGGGTVGTSNGATSIDTGFHTFGILWEVGHLAWYVDGAVAYDYANANVASKQMYVICNLAGQIGSSQPTVDDLPMTCDVDYIRVWS